MRARVGRCYHFTATHSVEGAAPPYNEKHEHRYTIELRGEGDVDREGFAAPLDRWDEIMRAELDGLDGADLNLAIGGPTTVEALAEVFLERLRRCSVSVLAVCVWEDDDRWAECSF